MLVLSRKVGERIQIDGGIEIVVLAVEGKRVRLGIEAPQDYRISRGETVPPVPATPVSTTPVSAPRVTASRLEAMSLSGCTA